VKTANPLDSITVVPADEVARRLGRCRATVARWERQGRFPHSIRLTDNASTRGYLLSDIQAWIEKRKRSRKPRYRPTGNLLQEQADA
jgi:predicted DNA-binding transcriptional regulator AlpA